MKRLTTLAPFAILFFQILLTSSCYAQRVAVTGGKVQKNDYLATLKQQLQQDLSRVTRA